MSRSLQIFWARNSSNSFAEVIGRVNERGHVIV
jgi:hypothetical protein